MENSEPGDFTVRNEITKFFAEKILFECKAPRSSKAVGLKGTDFMRQTASATFFHLRFSRPLLEGDNVEIKVSFHGVAKVSGQCLFSITPKELLDKKAKTIINQNLYVVDPTTVWISHLKDNDYRRTMRFGVIYQNSSIQLRLPGETEFFPVFYVPRKEENVWIDLFFCEQVRSVGLRTPLFPKCPPVIIDVDEDDLLDEPSLIETVIKKQGAQIHIV